MVALGCPEKRRAVTRVGLLRRTAAAAALVLIGGGAPFVALSPAMAAPACVSAQHATGSCGSSTNTTAHAAPTVRSADYPDDGMAHGGPGVAGTFTITPADSDVVKIMYGWSSSPEYSHTATGTTPVTLSLTPPSYGGNTLYVQATDGVSYTSSIGSYSFLVARPDPAVAGWSLEKWPYNSHAFTSESGPATDLTTTTAVGFSSNARLVDADTADFDGATSYAATTGPVVDTSHSFSFAAWARLDDVSGSRTVMAQDGQTTSSFRLQYRETTGTWCMTARDADASTGSSTAACGVAPVAGRWTHLAGVYDDAAGEIRLYVNGTLAATAAFTDGWNATGPTTIGRAKDNGSNAEFFAGQIAAARVYDRVITPEEITDGAYGFDPLMKSTEVGAWGFDDACCGETYDLTTWGRPLELSSSVSYETDPNGMAAGTFDGVSASGAVSGPVVRTDQSFSVSALVKLSEFLDTDQTAVAQSGTTVSGFYLGYRPNAGAPAWGFAAPDGDASSGVTLRTAQSPTLADTDKDRWVHLVGVYDAAAGQLILYVDGVQVASTPRTASWNATGALTVGAGQTAPTADRPR